MHALADATVGLNVPHREENTSMQLSRPAWSRRHEEEPDTEETQPTGPIERAMMDPATLIVARSCVMDGQLVTNRPILVLGEVRGRIVSRGAVFVAEAGSVQGDIEARSVFIHGAVVGDVDGRREVLLSDTGKLHGNVVTSSFELQRGAFFDGNTRMLRPQYTGWRRIDTPDA
jgi:cytoskeletal protein CcmA (bactofilin family)